jgi:hypothetical protein
VIEEGESGEGVFRERARERVLCNILGCSVYMLMFGLYLLVLNVWLWSMQLCS